MKKIFLLIAVSLLFGTVSAYAGTTQQVDMDIEIPTILMLDWNVDGSSVQLTGANKITDVEFVAGYKDMIYGGTLQVNTNAAWNLTVEADADEFVGGSNTKPTSEMAVDLDDADSYAFALNGITPVTLYTNEPAVQGGLHDIQYKMLLFPDDSAGTYAANLTYTLSAY